MTVLRRKKRGDRLEKGQWYINQDAEISVVCPGCGGVGNLNEHRIASVPGGAVVSPSLLCECGFHDDVVLKDWDLEE